MLLDKDSPTIVGGVFLVLEQYGMLTRLAENLRTGERLCWDGRSPEFIASVRDTGTPFEPPPGPRRPDTGSGLAARLDRSARILDTSCGAGAGLRTVPGRIMSGIQYV